MHISGYRYRRMHMALVGFGALPFVIWSFRTRSVWPEFATAAYLVTAALALTLLIGYPGPRSGWYWKVFGWTLVLHAAVLSMLAAGALAVVTTGVKPPVVTLFGLAILAMAGESWVALRLIAGFMAHADRD